MPKNWKIYSPFGKPFPMDDDSRGRFVAFKVPSSTHPSWTLYEMMNKFPELNLVIDLCATDKYYKLENLRFTNPEVDFLKIRGPNQQPTAKPNNEMINK